MTRHAVSQRVHQVEAERLLKGRGRFTDNVTLAREAHSEFLHTSVRCSG